MPCQIVKPSKGSDPRRIKSMERTERIKSDPTPTRGSMVMIDIPSTWQISDARSKQERCRDLRPFRLVFSRGVTTFGIPGVAPTTRGKIIGKPTASPTVFETGSGLGTSAMKTLEFAYGSVISKTALS